MMQWFLICVLFFAVSSPARAAAEAPKRASVSGEGNTVSRPKLPESLKWSVSGGENGHILYKVNQDALGKVELTREIGSVRISEYVHPDILHRLANFVQEYGLENWAGFPGCSDRQASVGYYVYLSFADESKPLYFHACSLPAGTPPGFMEAEKALFSILDGVLDAVSEENTVPAAKIHNFSIHSSGMSPYEHIVYNVYRRLDPAGPVVIAQYQRGFDESSCREIQAGAEWLTELEILLEKNKVQKWNGFKGTTPDVLDGTDFSLSLNYVDGSKINASGHMCFPNGYAEVWQGVKGLFRTLGLEQED